MGYDRGNTDMTGDGTAAESVVLTCDTCGDARASWGIVLFAVALAGYGRYQISLKPMDWSRDGPILAAFVYVFPAIAAGLALRAIWTTLRWRRHGQTLLEVAVRGRSSRAPFSAVAHSSSRATPRGPAMLTLERLRTVRIRQSGQTRTRTEPTWKASQSVEAEHRAFGQAGSGTADSRAYPFRCDIPPAARADARDADETIHWTVTMTVPTDGVDLVARFDVPEYLIRGHEDEDSAE